MQCISGALGRSITVVSHCCRGREYLRSSVALPRLFNPRISSRALIWILIGQIVMQSRISSTMTFCISPRAKPSISFVYLEELLCGRVLPGSGHGMRSPTLFHSRESIAIFKQTVQLCTDVGHNTFPRLAPYGLTMLSSCQCTLTCVFHDGFDTQSQS